MKKKKIIRDELTRQEKISRLYNKFKSQTQDFSEFIKDKEIYFSQKRKSR